MPQNKENKKNEIHTRNNENGNVFIFILMGIVLFAALSFTISRGMRSDTTNSLSDQQVTLAASDILSYAQRLERAVSKIRRKNISENDISFENPQVGGYVNANCTVDNCKIFSSTGGALSWQTPPEKINDGSDWIFTGQNNINGVGTNGSVTGNDVVALLGGINESVCAEINDRVGLSNPPPIDTSGANFTKFTGAFSGFVVINGDPGPMEINGQSSGCFFDTPDDKYYFYHTLIER